MPGIPDSMRWTVGLNVTLIGALALWFRWESTDLERTIELASKDTYRQAQVYADTDRAGRFTSQEFDLAIQFRDEQIQELETKYERMIERFAKQETILDEYRDWVRSLGPKVNGTVADIARLEGQFTSIGHHVATVELDLSEVKEKQDQVREELIPRVESKIDSHTSKPHNNFGFTPNAN